MPQAQRRCPGGGNDGLERGIAAGPEVGNSCVHARGRLGPSKPLVGTSALQQKNDVPRKRRAGDLPVESRERLVKSASVVEQADRRVALPVPDTLLVRKVRQLQEPDERRRAVAEGQGVP